MENQVEISKGWKRFVFWISLMLLLGSVTVWVLLFATFSANEPMVIPVRRFYLDRIVEPRYLPDNLPFTITVRDTGKYIIQDIRVLKELGCLKV